MERETLVPELAERQGARGVRRTLEAAAPEISTAEQAAIGVATETPSAAFHSSVVIGLQRTAGNAAVTGLLRRSLVTTDDQEAMTDDQEATTDDQSVSSAVLDVVGKGRGQPLDPRLQDEMEARLGDDFSDVRIHTGADAARSAASVSARAFTVGNEVVLGADAPALDSPNGRRTLAHELTHVIQQRHGPVEGTMTADGISISDPSDRFEQAAEANAARVVSDREVDARRSRVSGDALGLLPAPSAQRQLSDALEDEAVDEEEEAAEYQEQAAEYQEQAAEYQEESAEEEEEEQEEGG